MSLETVTIVVPTYKRPEKLARAIRSILAQTYKNIRIIVCDNASSDGTKEVVANLIAEDSRIEYHCHGQNIGMIRNVNFAYSLVRTPFFGILTDDDHYAPTFIADAMQTFHEHPHITFA